MDGIQEMSDSKDCFIFKPSDLLTAIKKWETGADQEYCITQMAKYKWYNYYQYMYIKRGSWDDEINAAIFGKIYECFPELHAAIESKIDGYIEKLNNDID